MPLPMVHLSVAVHLFGQDRIPAGFLLGSIAPDAIHMRKNTNREDKKRTHLNIESSDMTLDSLQPEYFEYLQRSDESDWKWFVRGYFAHLLTDYYWLQTVFRTQFREKVEAARLSPEDNRRAYYKDTDQIDFNKYKNSAWTSEVWQTLIAAEAYDIEPLLSADEISYWRYRTIHWFDLLCKEPGITPQYITEAMVDEFIELAAAQVRLVLQHWEQSIDEGRSHFEASVHDFRSSLRA
ncbi:zinc dependent phospholipase C family protein [Paenibacillus cremeus]|uniref:Phospholipase C/D domain-containing protein n=1 Tax=Paenibacillus cremeus TaxID=2163881 RepID=A0A559KEF6_9BACL|nr:zinc dependent phospholipase C family protein [Paenibacillus cremeus]TVY10507.1 hypothetical protein FPZ49_07150 [Paenibacillus cremeus]